MMSFSSRLDEVAARIDALTTRFADMCARRDAEPVSARELVLFATNTGQFYQQHLEMARRKADERAWARHVSANIVPQYKHEIAADNPPWVFHRDVIDQAARELKRYYEQHLSEF